MIILDTNVISELMRGRASDPHVVSWLRSVDRQPVTTVINRAEVLAGIAVLPRGQRRDQLRDDAEAAFSQLGVVLPLTDGGASHYAEIIAARRSAGRPISVMDALICAVARDCDCQLATRDVGAFEGLGVDVVNPWAN